MSALSAALLIFSFHIGRQVAPALRRIGFNTQYLTSDVTKNLGRYLSCAEGTSQEKDLIDSNGKNGN